MINKKIINDYNNWAKNYDQVKNPTRDLDQKILKTIIHDIKNKDIIEAGCGTGKNTVYLSQSAKSIIAFDISPEMLKIAKSKIKNKNVKFYLHDILKKWPVESNNYDIVTINLVLEHIQDISFIINEAYRVLRKTGKFYICEFHPKKQIQGSKTRFVDEKTKKIVILDSYYHDKNAYTSIGKKAGFKNIQINDWYDEIDKEKNTPRIISIIYEK